MRCLSEKRRNITQLRKLLLVIYCVRICFSKTRLKYDLLREKRLKPELYQTLERLRLND